MKAIKSILVCLLSSFSLLSVVSCGEVVSSDSSSGLSVQSSSSSGEDSSSIHSPITIADMLGRKVSVDVDNVNNVVCIGAGALRLYSYINGVNKLSGVEDIDNPSANSVLNKQFASSPRPYYMVYGDSVKRLPSCGKGGPQNQAAESELIISCHPDLIFSEYEDATLADNLQNATDTPVLVMKYDSSSIFGDSLYGSLRMIGKAVSKEERAEELINYITSAKNDLNNRTKDIQDSDKPSVYLGCLGNWGVQDIYMTCKDYPLFSMDNIRNAADDVLTVNGFQNIDIEKFLTLDADKIIIDASGVSKFRATYNADKERFDNLKAFQDGEIYLQLPYNNYYTNIEVALMDAYYDAKAVYPAEFEDMDIEAKSNEISEIFLGKALYKDMSGLPNSYGGFQKINVSEFFK